MYLSQCSGVVATSQESKKRSLKSNEGVDKFGGVHHVGKKLQGKAVRG